MKTKNTNYIEIERKYKSSAKEWEGFVKLVTTLNPVKKLHVFGPDTYYSDGNNILRWRFGPAINELTIKHRLSSSNLVRSEKDLPIGTRNIRSILEWVKTLGFKKLFRIHKECKIFWLKDKAGAVSVVIYKVRKNKEKEKYFIEIEAEKGQPYKKSKELVQLWEKKLKLSPSHRVNKSLYEIYSGEATPTKD